MSHRPPVYPAIPTTYGRLGFRSRTEARWAMFFDLMDIRWDYEPGGFRVSDGAYLPDFHLIDQGAYLEVKGATPTATEARKCRDLAVATGCKVMLAAGAPDERFSVRLFEPGGARPELWTVAWDRNPCAGMWLVAEDDAERMGPRIEGERAGGPMFSGALEDAFAAARTERFEGGVRWRRASALAWAPDRQIWQGAHA